MTYEWLSTYAFPGVQNHVVIVIILQLTVAFVVIFVILKPLQLGQEVGFLGVGSEPQLITTEHTICRVHNYKNIKWSDNVIATAEKFKSNIVTWAWNIKNTCLMTSLVNTANVR